MDTQGQTWNEVNLEDFGEIVSGGTPSRNNASYWNGSIPWVTPGEITGLKSQYLDDTQEKITPEGLAASAAKLLPIGSVLVTTRATIGESAIAAVPVTTNQGFKSIIPNDLTDPLFTYYRIGSLKQEMVRLASGTTFLEISKVDFSRIRTLRPDRKEQNGIAAVLNVVDKAIAKTLAVIAKLKQMRAGLLHDLLTCGLDGHGQLRNPIAHPEQFKDSPLGMIPKEWIVVEVAVVCQKIADRYHTTPRYVSEGIRMVSPTHFIGEDEIDFESCPYISLEAHSQNRQKTDIIVNDVIIHRIGAGLGRVRIVEPEMPEFSILHSLAMIRPNPDRIFPRFLYWALQMDIVQAQVDLGTQSIGVPDLGLDKIGEILMPFPIILEQEQVASALDGVANDIRSETRILQKLNHIKSGLMADLLTGRVRVPESITGGLIYEESKTDY